MDPMRDVYLTSGCSTSVESPSYLCSTSHGYHHFQSYAPVQPTTCHTVGWDAPYQPCSSYQPRLEPVHSPTAVPNVYPVKQGSHTSSACVGLPPYKFTSSGELPQPIVTSTFSHPPPAMLCDDQQQHGINAVDHKINDDKVKLEDFHSSLRAATSEG